MRTIITAIIVVAEITVMGKVIDMAVDAIAERLETTEANKLIKDKELKEYYAKRGF